MSSLLIDGYTLDREIPARGRLPALKFRYRPSLPDAAEEFRIRKGQGRSGKDRVAVETKFILDHLISWDAKGSDGNVILTAGPGAEEALNKFHEHFRTELLTAILWGITEEAETAKN